MAKVLDLPAIPPFSVSGEMDEIARSLHSCFGHLRSKAKAGYSTSFSWCRSTRNLRDVA